MARSHDFVIRLFGALDACGHRVERIASAAIEPFGRIETLVNNACVFIPGRSLTSPNPTS
jgi:hypothetical protein